jgi:hypothetical protein
LLAVRDGESTDAKTIGLVMGRQAFSGAWPMPEKGA